MGSCHCLPRGPYSSIEYRPFGNACFPVMLRMGLASVSGEDGSVVVHFFNG